MKKKIKTYSPKKKKRKPQVRTLLKKYREKDGTKVETEPERLMKVILRNMGIAFTPEHPITHGKHYRVYDFYCYSMDEYCFMIETDGSWWHAKEYYTENKPLSKLHKIQRKNIKNDKLKNKIAKERGIPLLRFWEDDIKKNPEKCRKAILEEVERQKSIYRSSPG
jgi:very-short-patch-repair endonuclease